MLDSPHALAVLDLDQRRERPGRYGRVGILRPLDARERLAADTFGTAAMVTPTWVTVARDPRQGRRTDEPWHAYKWVRDRRATAANRANRNALDARRAREGNR